jgi:DNA-binding SARP family transcriptional activator
MITLRTLGAIGLATDDGRALDGLLRQPKRFAVLAYLACPRPGTWHRRDTLMAMFWPELDSQRARGALRNALYVIRQQVGAEVVRTRGDDEVSLDPEVLQCDAGEFRDRLEADRVEDALALWQGEFLPGLFIPDAAEFEHWLDAERRGVREAGAMVLARASLTRETAGDLGGAASLHARLVDLDPADEGATRRLITLLDRLGQRSKAEAAFDRLRAVLRSEYDAEPSAETVRCMADLRARPAPAAPARDTALVAQARVQEQPPSAERPVPGAAPRRWPWWAAAAALLLVPLALWLRPARIAGSVPSTIVVLPMENRTGNPAYADIATALSDDIAERLSTLPAVTIRSNPRHDWSPRVRDSLDLLATRLGAAAALRGVLSQAGDSAAGRNSSRSRGRAVHRAGPPRCREPPRRSCRRSGLSGALAGGPPPHRPDPRSRGVSAHGPRMAAVARCR